MDRFYPIGTPGRPWNDTDRHVWFERQRVHRSYQQEVLARLDGLDALFTVSGYGALPIDPARYPLFAVIADRAGADAPWVLVTGGVHGYETSGVQGALAFLAEAAFAYVDRVNLLVLPCVSPWGYETVNRWNPDAVDPNRAFVEPSPCTEAGSVMALVRDFGQAFLLHVDLHETTDSDEHEFRPALAARDGKAFEPGTIPDGFYTVGDADAPAPGLYAAVVGAVAAVTHIAPAAPDGRLVGCPVAQPGVIHLPFRRMGLCAGVTDAPYTTTTEVYPDSSRVTDEVCNRAQVAALRGALDYVLAEH